MKRLNVKLLAILVVGTIVFVVGVHFLHAFQVDRNATTLLAQAQRAHEDGEDADAAKLYSQYLKHRDDPQAYSELAAILTDIAKSPGANRTDAQRAFSVLEEAVRLHPDLNDVRRLLADYTMGGGRLNDAIQHFETLRTTEKDPVIDTKYARCKIAMGRDNDGEKVLNEVVGYSESAQSFNTETARGPNYVPAYVLLANLLRIRLDNAERADQVMAQMVAVNKDDAQAYLEHGQYVLRFDTRESQDTTEAAQHRADADFTKALELAPDDPSVILQVAESAWRQKDYDRAQTLLDDGIKKAPQHEGLYHTRALLARGQKKPDLALEELQRGLKELPKSERLTTDLIDVQLELNDLEGVKEAVAKLQKIASRENADFAAARLMIARKEWLEAAQQLERLRPLLARSPDKIVHTDFFLGQCYENLSQNDRAADAYKRALDADATNMGAAVGYARTMQATGKLDEANKVYEQVDKVLHDRDFKGTGVAGNLLQNEINRQLKLATSERDWSRVDQLVSRIASDATTTEVQKALLTAEILIVKGSDEDFKQATALLVATRKAHPDELAVWLTMNKLLQKEDRKGKNDNNQRSMQLLDLATKQLGDIVPLRTARADIISREALGKDSSPEKVKQAVEQLQKLEIGLDKLSAGQQLALMVEIGTAYYRLRDYENVKRCWEFVKDQRPTDPKIRETLFNLSQEFNDDAGMTSAIEDVKKVLGPNSAMYNYCQAAKIVADVKSNRQEKKALAEAREYIKVAAKERSDWHQLPRLEGEIDEIDLRYDSAIANYQRALELGPLNAATGNRLLYLLFKQRRMADAKEVLRLLGKSANSRIREVLDENPDAAITSAKEAAAANPTDVEAWQWLGTLLSRAGRLEEAEETYRKVVEIAPQSPQGYLVLIDLLMNLKKKAEAEEIIRQADQSFSGEAATSLLAQCYEMIGDQGRAEKFYLELLEENADDTTALRSVATYYLRVSRPDKAAEFTQRILDTKTQPNSSDADDLIWARRAMAQILASRGDYQSLQKAVKLIESNANKGQYAPADTLMLASLLAQRPELVSRNRAIELLETLEKSQTLKLEEQLVLVQLYDRVDRWEEARERMGDLLTKAENNPTYLATFAQLLIKHDDIENAEPWVARLASIQPDSPVTAQLQAAVLVKKGQAEKAVTLLSRLIKRYTADQIPRLVTVATVLEDLNQYAAAEKILRDFSAEEPRATLVLAGFLARRGSTEEALTLCGKARKSHPLPSIIQVGLGTLRQRPQEVTKAQHDLIQGWLEKAMAEDPDSSSLQLQLADFRDQEGKFDEVVKIYRAYLERDDVNEQRKAVARNNLAFLLATVDGSLRNPEEALQSIDEAIRVLGPSGDLLDTRAMAYLAKGQVKEALADMSVAVADNPSPTKYMHMAMVQKQAGNKAAAQKAFKDAQNAKFDPAQLSIPERKNYEQLAKDLKAK